MKAQHTPGPWRVNAKVKTSVEQTSAGQGINLIAHTEDCDGIRKREEDYANARLIAAAPEMFEALQIAHAMLRRPEAERGESRVSNMINDLIAKIEGK